MRWTRDVQARPRAYEAIGRIYGIILPEFLSKRQKSEQMIDWR
jgi:hypothetical protein